MSSRISKSKTAVAGAICAAAAVVAACGGSSGGGSTSNQASAPGITPTSVTIGSTQPLTGPAAPGYSEIAPASKAYFQYVNAHGGVFGRSINYTYLDDQYNPTNTLDTDQEAGPAGQRLRDVQRAGHADASVGRRLSQRQKVPDLLVSSGCNCWNNVAQHPYTFGYQPDYTIEGKILGQYIKQTYAGMKVGYFAQGPNDEFGDDGVLGLNDALQGGGVTVASPVQYYTPTAAGAMGVKAEMAALQGQGVQVIAAFSIPVFTATALASAASIGYHPIFVVSNVGSDPPTLTAILTGGALGVTLPQALIGGLVTDEYAALVSDSANPWVTLFKSIKSQYAPSLPWDGNVAYGMGQAYLFVQALKAAGQNPSRLDIVHALENGHFTGPGIVPFGYSSSNHLGYIGAQVVTIGVDGTETFVGSAYTTDDTPGGAITQYSGTPSTPPANGIP